MTQTPVVARALDRSLAHLRSMANEGRYKSPFTPVLTSADTAKRAKYQHMAEAAGRHLDQRTTFEAFALTVQGVLSEGALKVLGFISAAKRAEVASAPVRRDGLTAAHVVRAFDRRLRDELAAAIARGWGGMLRAAGRRLPLSAARQRSHLI